MAKRTTSATRKSAAPKAGADKTGIPEGLPSATATAPQHAQPVAAPISQEEPKQESVAEQPAAPSPTIASGDSPNVQATATGQGEPKPDVPQGIVRITSRIEGFRRAGMRHSKTPTDHPIDSFTDAQLALLETEPNLTIEYL